jgi:hypothetical protein
VAQKPLTLQQAKETVAAIEKCGGNRAAAGRLLKLPPGTIATRVQSISAVFPELTIPPGVRGGHPDQPQVQRTLAEEVQHTRNKEAERATLARLKEATRKIAELEDKIKGLEYASNITTSPSQWTLDTRQPKGKSPHIPLLFFSDAQAGEIIRADETDAPWDFNSDIFRQRYRKMIGVTVDLMTNHAGSRWSYPGIVYARGGDNISGGLHEDLRELGEDVTVTQQCDLVYEEEAAGIRILADVFGRVDVKSVPGNHDRTTKMPPTKLAWARSFDHLVHKMLANEFKNDKRVVFQTSKSPDIRFPIFDKRFLMSHGDKMGSGGGMGFVGPGAVLLRGWQKLRLEQSRLGYHVDVVMTGHVHYPMVTLNNIGNGSFTGTSEFGKRFRMEPQPPMQYLTVHHHKHGMVDVRPIYLAD